MKEPVLEKVEVVKTPNLADSYWLEKGAKSVSE